MTKNNMLWGNVGKRVVLISMRAGDAWEWASQKLIGKEFKVLPNGYLRKCGRGMRMPSGEIKHEFYFLNGATAKLVRKSK